MRTIDNRITELAALAAAEGIPLPYPPAVIARIEDAGAVVDLVTGAILPGAADMCYRWAWTPVGEAVAHLLFVESAGRR